MFKYKFVGTLLLQYIHFVLHLFLTESLLCGAQDKCCCEQCVTAVDKGHKGWVLFGVR